MQLTDNKIQLVSFDSQGNQPKGDFSNPSISADGRYVAFELYSDGIKEIFVRDTLTGTSALVSVGSQGSLGNDITQKPSISANGRYVAFITDNIYVRDTLTGTTTPVSVDLEGNLGGGEDVAISASGRYVAFESWAHSLNSANIFVRDTLIGTTTLISVDSQGNQGNNYSSEPSISADGRYVAFRSDASNLVPGDTNIAYDIFVRDTLTNTTTRVSVDSQGNQENNQRNARFPSISADGRYIAFVSYADSLVSGDTNDAGDIFVRDTLTGTTTRVSVDSQGNQGNGTSNIPSISASGRYVAFQSNATNLVPEDTNNTSDIFVRDTFTGKTAVVSVDVQGNLGNGNSQFATISADGRYVAFVSDATNLVPGDTNNASDIFVANNPLF